MSSKISKLLILILSAFSIIQITLSSDPNILTDYITPTGTIVDSNFFTFTGFRALLPPNTQPTTFKPIKAGKTEFPALDGQSVSYTALVFPSRTINPPHTHPRSAELLFLAKGSLQVGFVDTNMKLFTQTLQPGDMFVFPKGLVHFQFNSDSSKSALAFSAFGSANAGTVSIASTLFNTTIDDNVLALAFKTDVATVQSLKKGFAS